MSRRAPLAVAGPTLPLEFAAPRSRLPERIVPMQPTEGAAPFDDPGYLFEPWWPGVRLLVHLEERRVRLQAEALTDPAPAFPELAAVADLVAGDGVVVDATLLVLDRRGRPSRALLDRRLAGQRVGTPALVGADLLYLDYKSLAGRPFGERRGELAARVARSPWFLAGRGFVGDGVTVAEALGKLGFAGLSARRLDARLRRGPAGDAWYRVPVVAAPRSLPPLLAVFRRLPL
jgi:bifunctional non-homologous end joining protein LigD